MAGEILANVILKGDENFRESVDDMGDEMEGSAGSAAVLSGALTSLGGAASSVIPPSNHAANAIDEVGDESTQTAGRVGILSGSFATLSATSSGLAFSLGLVTTSLTSVAGAIGLVTLALAPLLPVVLTAAGAFGALAVIFGAIVGSGIVAWMDATGTKMKDIAKAIGNLVKSFGKQFIPLIKDAAALLPSFIKKISQAVGNLDPFVHALRVLGTIAYRVIPPLIGLFADLARAVLPFVIDAAKWIGKRLVPALDALFDAGMRAAGEVFRLGKALFNVAKSLAGVAGWVGRFATALYDLAAAALGVGKLTKELKRVGQVIRQGLQGAFQWLSTTGVKLARQAFSMVADAATAAFDFAKTELLPAIKTGLSMAWQWVRTKGVKLAKKALGFLADKAIAAFEFTRKQIVPAVKSGLSFAWEWLRTQGVTLAKQAFGFVADKALAAFEFTKQEIIPAVKSGLGKAWHWIKTKGKKKAKDVFKFLSDKAIAAFEFTKKQIIPKVRDFVETATHWIRTKGKRKLQSAMKWLAKKGAQAFDTLKKGTVSVTKTALRAIGRALKTHAPTLYTTLRGLAKGLTKIWQMTGSDWVRTVGKFIGLVVDIIRGVSKAIIQVIRPVLNRVSKLWKRHGKDIELIVSTMAKVIGGAMVVISEAIRLMVKTVSRLLRGFTTTISKLWNMFGDEIVSVVRFFTDMVMSVLGAFIDTIATIIRTGMAIIKGDWKRAWKLISGVINRILKGIGSFVIKWADRLLGNFDETFSKAWQRIHKFGVDSLNTIKNFFGDIIDYFQTDFVSDVVSALKNAAKQAVQAFKNAFNAAMPDKIGIPSVTIGGRTIGGGSIPLPSLDVGGEITSDGIFYGHAGETIVPADADTPYAGDSGGTQEHEVVIDVRGDNVIAEAIRRGIATNEQSRDTAMDRVRGSFGGS